MKAILYDFKYIVNSLIVSNTASTKRMGKGTLAMETAAGG